MSILKNVHINLDKFLRSTYSLDIDRIYFLSIKFKVSASVLFFDIINWSRDYV